MSLELIPDAGARSAVEAASLTPNPLLNPHTIAVVGASQRAARGTRVVRNLISIGFSGGIFPINPKYDEVLGLRCYPSVDATPEPVDSLVVAIPAEGVPPLLERAFESGVRAAVVLSSGFAEAGVVGRERHSALQELAERGMLICGPNCYGVLNVRTRAAAFSGEIPDPLIAGPVGLISQSGGFSNMVANPLMEVRRIGFSYIISCGNQAGVAIEDYIEYLVDDEHTRVIAAFVEGFRRPEKLRAVAARAAALGKPIVVLKTGLFEAAQQATLAHTGSLAGSGEVLSALLKQCGIVHVRTLNELAETICLFASAGQRRSGWNIGVLTGSGGECGYVVDAAEGTGLVFPTLAESSRTALSTILPDFGNPRNPLDGTGAMYEDASVFPRLIETLTRDAGIDVVAVNLGAHVPRPGAWAPHQAFADSTAEVAASSDKLIVAYSSLIGGPLDPAVLGPLAAAGVPYLEGTATSLQAISHLNRYRGFVARVAAPMTLRQPPVYPVFELPTHSGVLPFLDAARLLAAFDIPMVTTKLARTAEEAVAAAQAIGYPVVLKVESPDVVHKSDAGGVRLGLDSDADVRAAFAAILNDVAGAVPMAGIDGVLVQPMLAGGVETIVGVKHDPVFGPAVLFGLGGIFTEVLRDVALGVPPLSADDVADMLGQIRGRAVLGGARGKPPADIQALGRVLERVGALALALRGRLVALDINPVLVLPEGSGAVGLDIFLELR